MRKVLLASSALVAAAGVSAASADVTINVWQEFGFSSFSDNSSVDRDTMFQDGEMTFSFSQTSDSGLTYSAHVEMEVNNAQSGTDENSMSLSTADMGSITLGGNDDVSGSFATYLPGGRNMATGDDWTATARMGDGTAVGSGLSASATGAAYGDSNKVAYRSPNFGGLTFGMSYSITDEAGHGQSGASTAAATTGDNADTSMGMRYSTELAGASVSVQAHNVDNGEDGTDKSTTDAFGLSVSMNDLSLAVSRTSVKAGDTTTGTDVDNIGYGVGYAVNDALSVAVNLVQSEDDVSKDSMDTTSYSLSYTIAPGLNFAVAMNSYSYDDFADNNQDLDSDELVASIQANF